MGVRMLEHETRDALRRAEAARGELDELRAQDSEGGGENVEEEEAVDHAPFLSELFELQQARRNLAEVERRAFVAQQGLADALDEMAVQALCRGQRLPLLPSQQRHRSKSCPK